MQTKQQIQTLLAAGGLAPNTRLGQHFLIDLNLMRLLLDSAQITKNDVVLEVGCGTGSLTCELAERAGAVIAVELDTNLAPIAQQQLEGYNNVKVFNTDILATKNKLNPEVMDALDACRRKCAGRLLLVSNLPYSVASAVMINLVTAPAAADAMYVTVQKEVAQRMTAKPGIHEYGALSIILTAAGDIKTLRILKPTVFWPQPQVDSAMVSFARREDKFRSIDDVRIFSRVINLFMQHRRKMLKACTKFAAGDLKDVTDWLDIFARCDIEPTNRPEQLAPQDFVNIANLCAKKLT